MPKFYSSHVKTNSCLCNVAHRNGADVKQGIYCFGLFRKEESKDNKSPGRRAAANEVISSTSFSQVFPFLLLKAVLYLSLQLTKYDYRYCNKLSGNVQAYYKFRIKQLFTLASNAGLMYEKALLDTDIDTKMDVSGGSLFLGTPGAEAVFKKIAIGRNWQTPFTQKLANVFVKANNRAMLHVSVML